MRSVQYESMSDADIQHLLSLMPNAVPVERWIAQGSDWDGAQMHLTIGHAKSDPKGWNASVETLTKYGAHALAYALMPLGDGISLEVLFDNAADDGPVIYWNRIANQRNRRIKK